MNYLLISLLAGLSGVFVYLIRRRRRQRTPPPAWRDRWIGSPRVARELDPSGVWIMMGRTTVALMAAFAGPLSSGLSRSRGFGYATLFAGIALALAPSRWLVAPFIRLGDVRKAFWGMRVFGLYEERRAAAVLCGCLALARSSRTEPRFQSDLLFLRAELDRALPRGAIGVVAAALVHALERDLSTARALFALVDESTGRIFCGWLRRIALTWLVADAARRGDFEGLARRMRGRRPWPWRVPRFCYVMGRIAARLAGREGAPSATELRRLWLMAPHRHAMRPLFDRAASAPPPVHEGHPAPAGTPLLPNALAAHRDWLLGSQGSDAPTYRALLVRACRAWDDFSSSDDDGSPVLPQVRADLVHELLERQWALDELQGTSNTLDEACDAAVEEIFRDLDARCRALDRRNTQGRELPEIDEWIEWARLRVALGRAFHVGGERVIDGAYRDVGAVLEQHAVWLYNDRRRHLLAHTMFRWLLAEGRRLGDEERIRTHSRNIRCRPD